MFLPFSYNTLNQSECNLKNEYKNIQLNLICKGKRKHREEEEEEEEIKH